MGRPDLLQSPEMARPGISTKTTEKIRPGPKFWNPKKIPPKYRKKYQNARFCGIFRYFLVFSGFFGAKFWESRILGRGVFFQYFLWKFRVGPWAKPERFGSLVFAMKKFSKMISLNAKNLENVLLAEPQLAVMFPCRTLTRSAKVSCRTLQIAEPKALNSEKDHLAEPWNAGSFRKCPFIRVSLR